MAYQNWGRQPEAGAPPLPAEYRLLPGADQLDWEAHPWEVVYEAQEYPEGWPQRLLSRPHRVDTLQGRRFLLVQTGWVWVGQLPASA